MLSFFFTKKNFQSKRPKFNKLHIGYDLRHTNKTYKVNTNKGMILQNFFKNDIWHNVIMHHTYFHNFALFCNITVTLLFFALLLLMILLSNITANVIITQYYYYCQCYFTGIYLQIHFCFKFFIFNYQSSHFCVIFWVTLIVFLSHLLFMLLFALICNTITFKTVHILWHHPFFVLSCNQYSFKHSKLISWSNANTTFCVCCLYVCLYVSVENSLKCVLFFFYVSSHQKTQHTHTHKH